MKKLLAIFVLLNMVAFSCTENDFDDDLPENIFFALDKESVTISPDGGIVDIIVYSNYQWEISGESDWCTPSITQGSSNENGQKVTFSADITYDDREATFWFRCADEKVKLVVSQKLKESIIPDANNTFNIPAEGGIAVISYQTSVDCEVIIPEEAKDWITIAPATRGLVAQSATLHITENTTYDPRSAVIKVVAKGNNEVFAEYTINQKQNDAILAGEKNTFTVTREGGNVVFDYQTNVDCEVIIPVEARGWITIAPATKGLATRSTTLNIAENKTDEQRQATVKVVSTNNRELFAEYIIIQNPRCYIEYTSTNGQIVKPYNTSAFGASILSNTYENGVGIIEFYSNVTTIGNNAFKNCSKLKSITIPNSVTSIGNYAFFDCSSLRTVTIPDNVTKIGSYAFFNSGLRSVYCKATTPPQLESYVFFHQGAPGAYNKIGCDIYVPAMSVGAYKNASGWSEYAIDFVGYNF